MSIVLISRMSIRIIIIIYNRHHYHDNATKHNDYHNNNDDYHVGIMIRSNKNKKPYWDYVNVTHILYDDEHKGRNNVCNNN